MTSIERMAMKGKLAQAREKKIGRMSKFEALSKAIRQGINTTLRSIEDIEINPLSQMWSDLEVTWAEILSLRGDIQRLEKELGD